VLDTHIPRLSLRLANVFQSALAYRSGFPLAGFRKLDDLLCYRLLDVVVAVSGPQGDADLFEGYTRDGQRFLMELFDLDERRNLVSRMVECIRDSNDLEITKRSGADYG
jgi:hypothetical protein